MSLFLKIVGGLAIAFLFVLGLFVFWVWWKLRRLAKGIKASTPTPSTIELTPDPEAEWVNKDQAKQDLAALAALGYVRGLTYSVEGMPGVGLVAFTHPDTGVMACYYDHPALEKGWFDLCVTLADGVELTISSAVAGGELDPRPGTDKIRLPNSTAAELHDRLQQRIKGQALKRHLPENFAADFCAAYARDMAWRNAKEGTSEAEFRRVAAKSGQPHTEEQLKEGFALTKRKEIEQWSDEIITAFSKTTTLPVAEWKKYEGRMFIFRETFHPVAFLAYLDDVISLTPEQAEIYQRQLDEGALNPQTLLARITADTGRQFVKLGEVSEPRPTIIYGASEVKE